MQEIESYIHTFSSEKQIIIQQLRYWIGLSHPQIKETWKYKTLFFDFLGAFIYLGYDKKKDKLYLGLIDGIHLQEIEHLLEGQELKQVRHWYVPLWDADMEEKTLWIIHSAVAYREKKQKGFKPFSKKSS